VRLLSTRGPFCWTVCSIVTSRVSRLGPMHHHIAQLLNPPAVIHSVRSADAEAAGVVCRLPWSPRLRPVTLSGCETAVYETPRSSCTELHNNSSAVSPYSRTTVTRCPSSQGASQKTSHLWLAVTRDVVLGTCTCT